MAELVAKRYASALFEVGNEENKLDIFVDELKNIVLIFDENKEFFNILKSPLISKKEKKELVETVYKDKISSEILNFLRILADKDRISVIKEIMKQYKDLLNEKNNVLYAVAVTAIPLKDEQMEALKDKLSKATGKTMEITNEIDENILGGILIRMGYEEIDGTVKTRLEKLKKELSQIIA